MHKLRASFCSQFSILNSQFAAAALLSFLLATPALAWGERGHALANEAATLGLPTDMPHFFLRSFPELVWLGYEPDRWRGGGPSLDAWGAPDHFIDYEFAEGLALPRSRYEFIALMESSGRLRRFGITNATTGFAPWRIAELSETLTNQFRRWRSMAPGSTERTTLERGIIQTAGILGHYVADVANPHHTTIHYNGWASAENPHGYATDCGTHSRFESTYVSHAVDLTHVAPKVASPVLRSDYFTTALAFIRESNGLVEELYALDRDGAFDIFRPVQPAGLNFAGGRLATGASMLRDLWWSAWRNSARRRGDG
ncbi:MAG TPA: hypothetical protein VNA04_06500 [Thermoanaerobaculia bacterium]|nr:hypothetical protein [Thermoanaerobaculia bacterium]